MCRKNIIRYTLLPSFSVKKPIISILHLESCYPCQLSIFFVLFLTQISTVSVVVFFVKTHCSFGLIVIIVLPLLSQFSCVFVCSAY